MIRMLRASAGRPPAAGRPRSPALHVVVPLPWAVHRCVWLAGWLSAGGCFERGGRFSAVPAVRCMWTDDFRVFSDAWTASVCVCVCLINSLCVCDWISVSVCVRVRVCHQFTVRRLIEKKYEKAEVEL